MSWVVKRPARDGQTRYTAAYRDPQGRLRSAGTFTTNRAAERAGRRAEATVEDGAWIDKAAGRITFASYVEQVWWPSRHLEVTTKAAYRSYLDRHFLPFFDDMAMADILPSTVQAWVTSVASPQALVDGAGSPLARRGRKVKPLSPASITKYHVMLHSVFKRAVRDRVIAYNPCDDTELPKITPRRTRTLTPAEYQRLLSAIPQRYAVMVMTEIETGLRWGELIALRPRHIDFLRGVIQVEDTIVEVSKKNSPTGKRMIVKPYPKDDEFRTIRVSQHLLDAVAQRIQQLGLERDHLLFPSTESADGQPLSRNTFRTRAWLPAVANAQIDFNVRMHDLRHAHASWLLAGGADLKGVMERMGHARIETTQKYLHTLPDTDSKNLDAFERTLRRSATDS